ncbi:MAG: hypothetical protein AB8I08_18975 [Sandaracinaceae bacterium]
MLKRASLFTLLMALAAPSVSWAQSEVPEVYVEVADAPSEPAAPATTAGGTEYTPQLCQNGQDDDGDGAADCDDEDCAQLVFCVGQARQEEGDVACGNGIDDDEDGEIDCADPSCACAPPERPGRPGTNGIYQPRVAEPPPPEVGFMEHDDPRRYPRRQVERPITYLEGMLVPRLGLSVRDAGDALVQLGLGLSYGLLDDWQITVVAPPLRLAPNFDVENVALSSTLRLFHHEVVELGLYANVAIPLGTAEDNGVPEPLPTHHLLARSRYSDVAHFDAALRVRLHLDEWVQIDLSLPVVTLVFSEPEVRADLVFDARVTVSPIDYLYLGAWSGAIVPGPTYEAPKIPFGFIVGGTIPAHRRGPAVDLAARFGWPLFYDADFGVASADNWQMTLDVTVYSYLLP